MYLKGLTNLERLRLQRASLTDDGLRHLKDMQNLKRLFNIALTYDNEDSQCRRLYYEIFPEEDPVKREIKEEHDELYNEMKA